jgi:hypothetical protein
VPLSLEGVAWPKSSQATAEASALQLIFAELTGDENARSAVLAELMVDGPVAGVLGFLAGMASHLLEKNFGNDDAIALVANDLAARLDPAASPGGR